MNAFGEDRWVGVQYWAGIQSPVAYVPEKSCAMGSPVLGDPELEVAICES